MSSSGLGRAIVAGGAVLAFSCQADEPGAFPGATGADLFAAELTVEDGLGPLFNGVSCADCHHWPELGGGSAELDVVLRIGSLGPDGFSDLAGQGGPVARAHSIAELGRECDVPAGLPAGVTAVSARNSPSLLGLGLIAAIPDEVILAGAVPRGDGILGRPSWVTSAGGQRRLGRFGWKAATAELDRFVADAFVHELGLTNPEFPRDPTAAFAGAAACDGVVDGAVELDRSVIDRVTSFIAALPPPAPGVTTEEGRARFEAVGCADCHTPALVLDGAPVELYSDLLLHDVGSSLDDGFVQAEARGRDWRTTPLWGLRHRARLLHDGRAATVEEAIFTHAGEALAVVERYRRLSPDERGVLLAFLAAL